MNDSQDAITTRKTTIYMERKAFLALLNHVIAGTKNIPAMLPRLEWMRRFVEEGKHIAFYQGVCSAKNKGLTQWLKDYDHDPLEFEEVG